MFDELQRGENPTQAAGAGAHETRPGAGDAYNVEAFFYTDEEPGGYFADGHLEPATFADVIFDWLKAQNGREEDPDHEISEDYLEGADRQTVAVCCERKWLRLGPEPEGDEEGQALDFLSVQELETDPVTVVYLNDLYNVVLTGRTLPEADSGEGDQALS